MNEIYSIMKNKFFFTVFLTLSALFIAQAEPPYVDLLAGGSLDQWNVGRDGTGWTLEDGVVHRWKDKSGYMMTKKKYKDFEFVFDWKIAEVGNSGVIYRAIKGKGFEYQILDDVKHVRGKDPLGLTAGLYALVPPIEDKPYKAAGEWNTGRIIAKGAHIEHWLNGVKVLEANMDTEDFKERVKKSKFKDVIDFGTMAAPISLQDHGDDVWFRNLKIREL